MPPLDITVKTDGFRRAGRAWKGTVTVADDELSEEQLTAIKADPMFTVEKSGPTTPVGSGGDELIGALVQAIGQLDTKNEKHFTGKGVPEIKVLEKIVNAKVSGKQRDQAWKEFSAGA